MKELYAFDRETCIDLIIDTVHSEQMEKVAEDYVADKRDIHVFLGYLCDNLMDVFNDFLDEHQEAVEDGRTGRTVLPPKVIVKFMAGVFGEKTAMRYCRMRAFELLASRADRPGRERAAEFLDIAARLSEEAGKP